MNYTVYRMYCENKKIIQRVEACENEHSAEELSLLADLKLSQKILEEVEPEYLRKWEEEQKMFKSFTPEQRDFICYQIGDWYMSWQSRMWVDDKPNQHWLGVGKEHLKMMIYGD